MTDQPFPSQHEVQEAMRAVGAAIRLWSNGHQDDAIKLLYDANPTAAATHLVGTIVMLLDQIGADPAEYGETMALAHSQRLTRLDEEGGSTDE